MKRTVKICVGGAIFLGFSALLFLVFHLRSSDQNIRVVKIVVCGPMSGENRNDGEVMLKSTKLRIQQANENTSNTSIRFQVLPCNDENDPGIAKQAARQIVAAKNIYAVVGHLTSATSSAAGEIYKQAGIPAITATAASPAVITGNPWYFRTVVGNEQQGNLAAVYIHKILEHQNVTVIHDVDAYGQHLTDTFIHYWEDILGLKVKNVFPFGKRTSDTLRGWHGAREHAEYGDRPVDSQLNEIIARLELSGEPGMVFMAAHEAEAAELIKKMRNGGKNYQIFGGDSLSKATFVNRFTHDAMEKKFPGYYTDGIFATAHFLYDIAGWKAQEFFAEYWNTYGTNPDSSAASYYDSADLLVQTILALDFEKSIKEQREDIRNALANMDGPAKAFSGMTGDIYFDQHGGAIKPISVGYYQKSTIIAALNQLQRIYNSAEIPDPESVLKTGEVLIAGVDPLHNTSIYFEKTHVVYAGLHINEISAFDPRSLVHNMDFVLWFRYARDFP